MEERSRASSMPAQLVDGAESADIRSIRAACRGCLFSGQTVAPRGSMTGGRTGGRAHRHPRAPWGAARDATGGAGEGKRLCRLEGLLEEESGLDPGSNELQPLKL